MPKKLSKTSGGADPGRPRDEQYSAEEAMERMNRALRGAKIAGPKPLKEKTKIRGKGRDGSSRAS